ncbi:MAG: peptidoglycan-binding protein [Alicyclobacillus sp.]|nr:peptidoglycan-binding protein [Alicyclobacillus sp.]
MRKKLLTFATACALTSFPLTAFAATSSQGNEEAITTNKDITQHAANMTYYGNYSGETVSVGARVRTGPATPYPTVKILPGNRTVHFTKVTQGQMVGGTNAWYFDAADNGWISFSALKWVSYPGVFVYYGSPGPFVEEVQYKLNQLGYSSGTVDGIFGTKTLNAVRAFQKAHGLTVDGIVGPVTWSKLFPK